MLITGGGGGIGSAVSDHFSQNGWKVYSCDIAPQKINNKKIIPIFMDIRSSKSVSEARKIVEAETDCLDVIINLAGIYLMDSLVEIPEANFLSIFDINVNGAYRVNKEFLPLVKKSGRIIIITSELACLHPLPFNGLYSITKKALEAYAQSLRMELALINIPVITIRPGAVKTRLLDDSFSCMARMCENTKLYKTNASKLHNIMKRVSGKSIQPEKLAKFIYKIAVTARPKASYTIGAELVLRIFSILPANIQVMLLKKILR